MGFTLLKVWGWVLLFLSRVAVPSPSLAPKRQELMFLRGLGARMIGKCHLELEEQKECLISGTEGGALGWQRITAGQDLCSCQFPQVESMDIPQMWNAPSSTDICWGQDGLVTFWRNFTNLDAQTHHDQ